MIAAQVHGGRRGIFTGSQQLLSHSLPNSCSAASNLHEIMLFLQIAPLFVPGHNILVVNWLSTVRSCVGILFSKGKKIKIKKKRLKKSVSLRVYDNLE
jgi:hypothetical protein